MADVVSHREILVGQDDSALSRGACVFGVVHMILMLGIVGEFHELLTGYQKPI